MTAIKRGFLFSCFMLCVCVSASAKVDTDLLNFTLPSPDFKVPCNNLALEVERVYSSIASNNGYFGIGWSFNYNMSVKSDGKDGFIVTEFDGFNNHFSKTADKTTFMSTSRGMSKLQKTASGYTRITQTKQENYFDKNGKLVKSIDKSGDTLSITYDPKGYIQTVVGSCGEKLTFSEYDGHKIKKIVASNGNTYTYQYDGDYLIKFTDPKIGTLTYTYAKPSPKSTIKLMTGINYYGKKTVTNEYNDDGTVKRQIGPEKERVSVFSRKFGSSKSNIITTVTKTVPKETKDASEKVTTTTETTTEKNEYIQETNGFKLIQTFSDNSQLITTFNKNRKPTSISDSSGATSVFKYDADGRLKLKIDPSGKNIEFAYNGSTPQITSITFIDNSSIEKFSFAYDDKGNISKSSNTVTKDGKNSPGTEVSFKYQSGKISDITYSNGESIQYEYLDDQGKPSKLDKPSKIVKKSIGAVIMKYDIEGNLISIVGKSANGKLSDKEVMNNILESVSFMNYLINPAGDNIYQ